MQMWRRCFGWSATSCQIALGAAVMAGVGAGVFPSYEAGVAAMVRLERHCEPDAQQSRLYAAWFERCRPL